MDAVKASALAPLVESLPEGLDTLVGERGMNISLSLIRIVRLMLTLLLLLLNTRHEALRWRKAASWIGKMYHQKAQGKNYWYSVESESKSRY